MAPHSSKSVIYAALVGNLLVAASKFGAAWFTGSSAMLSEAIHSLVDTGNQGLLLNGMHQAAKPASFEHPFGHGLQLYFWTFIVAILIFGLGAGVAILEGIQKILNPHPLENPWINYTVLALSLVFEGITWLIALRAFRAGKGRRRWLDAIQSSKDPTVFTVLFEDTAALFGLLIAGAGIAAGQMFDLLIMDGMASVVIGLLLALTATLLAYESQSLLTGEGVQPEIRASIRNLAEEEPGVVRVNELLTMHFGPRDVLVALSLDFENAQPASSVESTVSRLERRIKSAYPEVTRVFIEAQSFEASNRTTADIAGNARAGEKLPVRLPPSNPSVGNLRSSEKPGRCHHRCAHCLLIAFRNNDELDPMLAWWRKAVYEPRRASSSSGFVQRVMGRAALRRCPCAGCRQSV
jgi:cation diffusion facilitator family transporter